MSLSLTAEQKELLKIFKIEEQYIIPNFQRAYSWEYEQCFKLYNDIFSAFQDNEDYFLGNIIIAKSKERQNELEVIDGQQRLITLLLMIKSLSFLFPELKVLKQLLTKESWEGDDNIPRIKSEIFEAEDNQQLQTVLSYEEQVLKEPIAYSKHATKTQKPDYFDANIRYFYEWFTFYKSKNDDLKDFVTFLLTRVYLLPIELSGNTNDEASTKALSIFETINNRGMSLEDADIFKAKLYKKAQRINEQDDFIGEWRELKYQAESLNITIDTLFRFYTHIIRGKEDIIKSEINLRSFFIEKEYSPFELKQYREILKDLFDIVEVVSFYEACKSSQNEIAKWIQLIDTYSNQYPKFAVIVFFFQNGCYETPQAIGFLKSLTRYIYFNGATTKIKFEIYKIISSIVKGEPISNYHNDNIKIDDFYFSGRLKNGYALLAFYLDNEAVSSYKVIKRITPKDNKYLTADWFDVDLKNCIDSLGNLYVFDTSKNHRPKFHLSDKKEFSYDSFLKRDNQLRRNIVCFFQGIES